MGPTAAAGAGAEAGTVLLRQSRREGLFIDAVAVEVEVEAAGDDGEFADSGEERLFGCEAGGGVSDNFLDGFVGFFSRFVGVLDVARYALGRVKEESATVRGAGGDGSGGEAAHSCCAEDVAGGTRPRGGRRPWLPEGQGALFLRLLDCLPEAELERVLDGVRERCPFAVDV